MTLQEQIEFIDNLAREYKRLAEVAGALDSKYNDRDVYLAKANGLNECKYSLKFLENIQTIINNHVK